jgi:hypothetical protein
MTMIKKTTTTTTTTTTSEEVRMVLSPLRPALVGRIRSSRAPLKPSAALIEEAEELGLDANGHDPRDVRRFITNAEETWNAAWGE